MLGISIIFVGASTYQLWQAGPWDMPVPGKAKVTSASEPAKEEQPQFQSANARNIIEKNLFDPERGATRTEKVQADNAALQRLRSMVLLGTAILGANRYAIMQEPSASRNPATKSQPASSGQMRLKLGDAVEGFKLAEIRDRSVVFTKGASKVELAIDFFRPGEESTPRSAAPAAGPPRSGITPRVGARVPPPRAEQTQTPAKQDDGSAADRARKALRERQLQPPQQPAGRPPQRIAPTNPESPPAGNPQ